jgi:alkanesulfonate monooxygenase SsuD/methylene tetrahydromethanopterin reductase-like flavin-dependent oxidoreductase (luciferase family)
LSCQSSSTFTVGVALDGAGWHPAAWREKTARADELFSPKYWNDLVNMAEAAGFDFATFEDALRLQSQGAMTDPAGGVQPGIVEGRLDALLTASWIAPRTRWIGLLPTVTTTYTEPFHVGTSLQMLDAISKGRAGWHIRPSSELASEANFGRRRLPEINFGNVSAAIPDPGFDEILDDTIDFIAAARRLWGSWEDGFGAADAHRIDFESERFAIAGPSNLPRSPQGQIPVTMLSHSKLSHRLAARSVDVVFVAAASDSPAAGASRGKSVRQIIDEVREAEAQHGRAESGLQPLRIMGDLAVIMDTAEETAEARLARLDAVAGAPFQGDARQAAGSVDRIADLIAEWRDAGLDGVRLRPVAAPTDLEAMRDDLLPVLRDRGLAPTAGGEGISLRERFGLPRTAADIPAAPRVETTLRGEKA